MEEPDDDDDYEEPKNDSDEEKTLLLAHCKQLLCSPDFVMEPQIVGVLQTFFLCGGDPETVVNSLADNYLSLGQICNIIGDWLECLEESREPVDDCLESTLSTLIIKHFHPDHADRIFETQSGGITWLPQLISHKAWRSLIFTLAEQYPQCLMLGFAVKLISDAGFQHEISNVNTAAQQLEIFSTVVLSSIDTLLSAHRRGPLTEIYEKTLAEFVRVVCHSEHTYLYTQALLHVLMEEENGMSSAACAHITQILRKEAYEREQDTSALYIALKQCRSEQIAPHLIQAMHTMMSKQCLNPADISQLYQQYVSSKPPVVDLIRELVFMDMLIDALFSYDGVKVHADHRQKYIYLLAYASSVCEYEVNGVRIQNRQQLEATQETIVRTVSLLESKEDLLKEITELLRNIQVPVVAAGLLHYFRGNLLSDEVNNEAENVHFVLLDEIATLHPSLQPRVFALLCALYDRHSSLMEAAEVIVERQRNVVNRFVHLLSVGLALPPIEKIDKMFRDGQIDSSLVRHFATEVLDFIEPPYSQDFIDAFLPIVLNPEVFDRKVKSKAVDDFIADCTHPNNEAGSSQKSDMECVTAQ